MSFGPSGSRRAAAFAAALLLWPQAACGGGGGGDPEPVAGLFDPCTSDGTADDLCPGDLVCVEAATGSGGRCEATPVSCVADDDAFCDCDLDALCDNGVVPICYVLGGRRGVICE